MEDDKRYLCCLRVEEVRVYTAGREDKCSICASVVWRSNSSPDVGVTVACANCMIEMMKESTDNVEIVPPTERQVRDLENYFNREQN
jgi:hypothetical protein